MSDCIHPNIAAESHRIRFSGLITALLAALTIISWSSAFAGIRAGLASFDPAALAAMRFGVAALPAALWLAFRRPSLPRGTDLLRIAFGAVAFVALYSLLLSFGQQHVPVAQASVIINTQPIMTAVLAMAFLGERFSARAWLGTVVAFGGVALLAFAGAGDLQFGGGALLILAAALCWALTTVVQKPLFSHMNAIDVAAMNILAGGLLLAPITLTDGLAQWAGAEPGARFAVLWLGLVPSAIAYSGWALLLARMDAGRAANLMYCVPPVATLIGFLWLGEVPSAIVLTGGLITLSGVAIVNLRPAANR